MCWARGHPARSAARGPVDPGRAGRHPAQPARRRTEAAPAAEQRPGYSRAALTLILAAAFMVVLDFSIVNVALASIQRELGFPAAAAQWVVTGYAITFGGLLILGGRAADLFGRRRMFLAGLIAFSVASLAGGLAQDPVLLVAARAVQGAGAALVAPAALSLITTGFPEGPKRTRALGLYGATASVGFVAGQVLGGVLVEFTSWRAVFLVNVPVGLAAVLLTPRLPAAAGSAHPAAAGHRRCRADHRGRGQLSCSRCPRVAQQAGPRPGCWPPSRWPRWPWPGSRWPSAGARTRWSAATCCGSARCARVVR